MILEGLRVRGRLLLIRLGSRQPYVAKSYNSGILLAPEGADVPSATHTRSNDADLNGVVCPQNTVVRCGGEHRRACAKNLAPRNIDHSFLLL
jgi:hypothetical protein